MKHALILLCAALMIVSVSAGAFAQGNDTAFFMIDPNVGETGYNGGSFVTGIGAGEYVGFAVYVKNTDQLRGFEIDVTWDGAMATWRSDSGPIIETDTVVFNGEETTLPDEANVLGSVTGLGEIKETGHYYINYSKLGGTAVATTDYGFLYFVMLKTATTFTTNDSFTVTANIIGLNDSGVRKDMGNRTFYVNGTAPGVQSTTWGHIKSQFKD